MSVIGVLWAGVGCQQGRFGSPLGHFWVTLGCLWGAGDAQWGVGFTGPCVSLITWPLYIR